MAFEGSLRESERAYIELLNNTAKQIESLIPQILHQSPAIENLGARPVVVCDIDGTLFDTDRRTFFPKKQIIGAVKAMIAANIKLVFVTLRDPVMIKTTVDDLKDHGIEINESNPLICVNFLDIGTLRIGTHGFDLGSVSALQAQSDQFSFKIANGEVPLKVFFIGEKQALFHILEKSGMRFVASIGDHTTDRPISVQHPVSDEMFVAVPSPENNYGKGY